MTNRLVAKNVAQTFLVFFKLCIFREDFNRSSVGVSIERVVGKVLGKEEPF